MIGAHVALCRVAMCDCILIKCHKDRILLITMAAETGLGKSMGRSAQAEDQHKHDRQPGGRNAKEASHIDARLSGLDEARKSKRSRTPEQRLLSRISIVGRANETNSGSTVLQIATF